MEFQPAGETKQAAQARPAEACAARSSAQPEPPLGQFTRLQHLVGNRAAGRLIQAKLRVNQPGDAFEQEADRVAEQVVGPPEPAAPPPVAINRLAPTAPLQRACNQCTEEEETDAPAQAAPALQAKGISGQTVQPGAEIESGLGNFDGRGEPLAPSVREFFEPRFAHDFSQVRIHTGAHAADMAQAINARAFTHGQHIAFGAGEYAPHTLPGRKLLAHELTHVVQQNAHGTQDSAQRTPADTAHARPTLSAPFGLVQRATGDTASGGTPASGTPANTGGTGARPNPGGFEVDVLAAEAPDDFLVRAAGRALGVDIRVRSLDDMITQLEGRTGGNACVTRLNVFNHANPDVQTVSGGNKVKSTTGGAPTQRPISGFSLNWLRADANQAALNRLRHSFCCGAQMNWYGCSTAGVWAEGGTRTAAEIASDQHRYTGVFGNFYHDVAEAAAHGATHFRNVGLVNVQSWANALCTPVLAATDFNNWRTVGADVIRTVIHGGQQVRVLPQSDMNCACDPATGRVSSAAPTGAQLRDRAEYLREYYLRPVYDQARNAIGREQPLHAETEAERTARVADEAHHRATRQHHPRVCA